jgi:large subunit ribosomal protein L17
MRHRVVGSKFGSDREHNKTLMNNLSTELILKEKVVTTVARAKYLRPYVEKLITLASKAVKSSDKIKKYNAIKELNRHLHIPEATVKMMNDIGKRFSNTPGGYTRIVRTGFRDGDQAEMARIEFTKAPEKSKSKTGKALSRLKKAPEEKVETPKVESDE